MAQRLRKVKGTVPLNARRNVRPVALDLPPINATTSFRNQAYALLRQAIAEAEIYSQEEEVRLDDRQLSEALGVSRTPIREAMTLLEQEGFLRTIPRRGIFIVRKTKKEIIEMIQMWAALESMAARMAAVHASDADIARLRHLFDEFVDAAPSEHINEYSEANLAFHQAIVDMGGSQIMADTVRNLLVHVRAIRKLTISKDNRAERSIIDHLKIVEALERRDRDLAEKLVRDHTLELANYVEKHCDFLR